MLKWCQNFQLSKQIQKQLIQTIPQNNQSTKSCRKLRPPSILSTKQPTNTTKHAGIKIHISHSFKNNKQTQTSNQLIRNRNPINQATQTALHQKKLSINSQCGIFLVPENPHSTLLLGKNTPQFNNFVYSELEQTKRKLDDYRTDHLTIEKPLNILRNQEKQIINDPSQETNMINHRDWTKNKNECSFSSTGAIRSKNQAAIKNRFPHKLFTFQRQKLTDSIKNPMRSQKSFIQKYKIVFRNVESQFKHSQKKQSEQRYKNTPTRRAIFYQKDTIISRFNDSNRQSDHSFPIEESFLLDPKMKSLFSPINQKIKYQKYSLCLSTDNLTGLIASIKEISIDYIDEISSQLLIYKQMDERSLKMDHILDLYESQIDENTYIFIKQPFTFTLFNYLKDKNHLQKIKILKEIQIILTQIKLKGFFLSQLPKIQDFVVIWDQIKIHNLQILRFDKEKILQKDALLCLEKEIELAWI